MEIGSGITGGLDEIGLDEKKLEIVVVMHAPFSWFLDRTCTNDASLS